MPNNYLSRAKIHNWSEEIGDQQEKHRVALQRLLRDQRRLAKFVQENSANLTFSSSGVGIYLLGVITRMFDLAGGRLKSATWGQIREAEKRIGQAVDQVLPIDAQFGERLRTVEWRAQPHILDEAIMSLFDRDEEDKGEEEESLDPVECAKLFFLLWVAVEVLDENWKPAKSFDGESSYTYVHIDPKPSDDSAPAEA